MKNLRIVGFIILVITMGLFIFWRLSSSLPDWFLRINNTIMLISVIIIVFTTARILIKKE
jgi:hypothetical protein